MEADFVTGPAKNLIQFAQTARPAVDLSVVAYVRGEQAETEFIRVARSAGIELDVVHETGRFDASVTHKLRAIAASRNPDVIQTHNTKSHFFLRVSGIWKQRIWLAFHHGHTAPDLKMRAYHQMDRWSLRAARHVVTVCGPFADQLVRFGVPRGRISILHNSVQEPAGIGGEEIARVRGALNISAQTPVLVSIGRLSHEKGHVDLLSALGKVRDAGADFHLVIVGEGIERGRIEQQRKKLNLESRVTLAGLRHDVRPYYGMADVVVLPSHSEGSPNVLLEAMIHARAIVATRVGGVPEIAQDGETALLVEARDPDGMAQAISRMLGDRALRARLAGRARQVAAERYSPRAYTESLTRLYQRLTEAPVPA